MIVVVGAGLSGLVAARQLVAAGHTVTVLEKASVVGGRLATAHLGGATLDSGAQFFTVRSEAFAAMTDAWQRAGIVREWTRGFTDPPDGYPRYAAQGGMATLAAHLAEGLDVRVATMCFAVKRAGPGWTVALDDGTSVDAEGLVLTCPVIQSASLLMTAEVPVPETLRRTDYDRTIALLVVLDRDGAVPEPGAVQQPGDGFSFVADNRRKGISALPALTLHLDHEQSVVHWDDARPALQTWLLEAARPWFGAASVVDATVRRWRFAGPQTCWPEPCWQPDGGARVVLAGDAFAGPKVEGAALSGLAAAAALTA